MKSVHTSDKLFTQQADTRAQEGKKFVGKKEGKKNEETSETYSNGYVSRK